MIEREILDRVPLYPGRIKLTPVAGAENTYDMERNDEPQVDGTPINKATLDSITQSRLTGRYYAPNVTVRAVGTSGVISVNPIPTSWQSLTSVISTSGSWTITASSNVDYAPHAAVDGNTNSYWVSNRGFQHTLTIDTGRTLNVSKMKLSSKVVGSGIASVVVGGSNNGINFDTLATYYEIPLDISLNSGEYRYYRLVFNMIEDSGQAYCYDWKFSEYTTPQYRVDFLAEEMPGVWDVNQRVMIVTPSNYSSNGVVSNTLNGVTVKVILQPNKRYELIYNGSSFDAKEV